MKILILSPKEIYKGKLKLFAESCKTFGYETVTLETIPEDVVSYVLKGKFDAVIHRNEHGRLFADKCLNTMYALVKAKIPALSLDLGYFAHYKSFMLDFYVETLDGLRSSIYNDWNDLPERVDWKSAPAYIQDYRNEVFKNIARADNTKHAGKVAIWMQWTTDLLRPELGKMHQSTWVNQLIEKLKAQGKVPVLKHNPVIAKGLYDHTVPLISQDTTIFCDREKQVETCPRLVYDKHANWNLVAGCDYHIVLCSSVTNILCLAKKPVIAMGQSWFNALDIFEEPLSLKEELKKPSVNKTAQEKWMNWWIQRQRPFEQIGELVEPMVKKAQALYSTPEPELWKYHYIYSHPKEFKLYGARMHGKKALPIVLDLAPKSLVDIGCGKNNFIPFIKESLPQLTALGVDPCAPEADLKASALDLPIPDKTYELLTSFDTLEHLKEQDLETCFSELRRVSSSFLFSISPNASKTTVLGQQLHPTVKPLAWWKEKLSPFVATLQEKDGYLFGHWK